MKNRFFLKPLAAVLLGALIMPLTACDGVSEQVKKAVEETAIPGTVTAAAEGDNAPVIDKKSFGWVSEYGNLRLDMPQTHLDTESVYKNIKYDTKFFYGDYCSENMYEDGSFSLEAKGAKEFFNSHKTVEYKYLNCNVNYLPVKLELSDYSQNIYLCSDSENNKAYIIRGTFEVKENQLVFTPEDRYKFDEPFVYDFSFKGTHLTLSNGSESVELNSSDFIKTAENHYISISSEADGDTLDGIKSISISKFSSSQFCSLEVDGYDKRIRNVAAYLGEDGRFNFSWADNDGTVHAYEMVYFYLDSSGLILTDGENVYRYTKR